MKKFIAVMALSVAVLSLSACGNQAPLMKQAEPTGTYVGVVEEMNDNVVVVTDSEGDSRLFWMTGDVSCNANTGDRVEVNYSGDPEDNTNVLTVTSVERV